MVEDEPEDWEELWCPLFLVFAMLPREDLSSPQSPSGRFLRAQTWVSGFLQVPGGLAHRGGDGAEKRLQEWGGCWDNLYREIVRERQESEPGGLGENSSKKWKNPKEAQVRNPHHK